MSKNDNLHKAKTAKADEFYTQLDTVEKEMQAYYEYDNNVFRGKTIMCPCDDPEWSNFAKHFIDKRHEYGYKKLICTCYVKDGHGKKLVLENGVGNITALEGNGDFRSEEVGDLLGDVDYIITNPPFSLFREFFAWIMKNEKKFSIVGNANAITNKGVFPYIKENNVWLGATMHSGVGKFNVPNEYELNGSSHGTDENGKKWIGRVNARLFTNIPYDFAKYVKPLELHTKAYWEQKGVKYPKYDNYDAIEVSKTAWIPRDYKGAMGVPITWLDKYCPEQEEIVGATESEGQGFSNGLWKGGDKKATVNDKKKYARIFIKHKNPEEENSYDVIRMDPYTNEA